MKWNLKIFILKILKIQSRIFKQLSHISFFCGISGCFFSLWQCCSFSNCDVWMLSRPGQSSLFLWTSHSHCVLFFAVDFGFSWSEKALILCYCLPKGLYVHAPLWFLAACPAGNTGVKAALFGSPPLTSVGRTWQENVTICVQSRWPVGFDHHVGYWRDNFVIRLNHWPGEKQITKANWKEEDRASMSSHCRLPGPTLWVTARLASTSLSIYVSMCPQPSEGCVPSHR